MTAEAEFNAVVISDQPLIVATKTSSRDSFVGDAMTIAPCFEGRSGAIIVVPAWTWRKYDLAGKGRARVAEFHAKFPNIRLIVLAADEHERAAIEQTGAETDVINQNAFLDYNRFDSTEQTEKHFDAVYTAQMRPFKRHALAAGIERLAIVYYGENPDYQAAVEAALPHAHFPNGKLGGGKRIFLRPEQMAELYGQSTVGLCLSAAEGTMWASAEYLLCGLPVVTTESIGGRDIFFDDYNSFRCDATVESVRNAVHRAIAVRRDPQEIRWRCIERMDAVRQDFYVLIDRVRSKFGNHSNSYADEFMTKYFSDKLWKRRSTLSALVETISRATQP